MEANSTVNLVPFGLGITELQMGKNCYFVVPVDILTPFAHIEGKPTAQALQRRH